MASRLKCFAVTFSEYGDEFLVLVAATSENKAHQVLRESGYLARGASKIVSTKQLFFPKDPGVIIGEGSLRSWRLSPYK